MPGQDSHGRVFRAWNYACVRHGLLQFCGTLPVATSRKWVTPVGAWGDPASKVGEFNSYSARHGLQGQRQTSPDQIRYCAVERAVLAAVIPVYTAVRRHHDASPSPHLQRLRRAPFPGRLTGCQKRLQSARQVQGSTSPRLQRVTDAQSPTSQLSGRSGRRTADSSWSDLGQ